MFALYSTEYTCLKISRLKRHKICSSLMTLRAILRTSAVGSQTLKDTLPMITTLFTMIMPFFSYRRVCAMILIETAGNWDGPGLVPSAATVGFMLLQ
jgi:hypothetical protein